MSKASKRRHHQKQREQRLLTEQRLDGKNYYGINDPTPKQAVDLLIKEQRNNGLRKTT